MQLSSTNIGFVLLLLMTTFLAQAQAVNQDSLWQIKYQERIKKDRLNGTYIPQNLADAHRQLNRLVSPEARQKFKNMTEDQISHKLFFSLGRWIAVNWSLYEGSRLGESLRKLGIYHPEDMANFIMITYHRKLLHLPLDAKKMVEGMTQKRKEEWENKHKVIKTPSPK